MGAPTPSLLPFRSSFVLSFAFSVRGELDIDAGDDSSQYSTSVGRCRDAFDLFLVRLSHLWLGPAAGPLLGRPTKLVLDKIPAGIDHRAIDGLFEKTKQNKTKTKRFVIEPDGADRSDSFGRSSHRRRRPASEDAPDASSDARHRLGRLSVSGAACAPKRLPHFPPLALASPLFLVGTEPQPIRRRTAADPLPDRQRAGRRCRHSEAERFSRRPIGGPARTTSPSANDRFGHALPVPCRFHGTDRHLEARRWRDHPTRLFIGARHEMTPSTTNERCEEDDQGSVRCQATPTPAPSGTGSAVGTHRTPPPFGQSLPTCHRRCKCARSVRHGRVVSLSSSTSDTRFAVRRPPASADL